jgi:hypothetical protein
MNFASLLRQELAERARQYAQSQKLSHSLSYGESPVVCFVPDPGRPRHGNFVPESYKAMVSHPPWRKRLDKVHSQDRRSLPTTERGCWRELDSCNSSDALLMNIFCHPKVFRRERALAILGVDTGTAPRFGYRARVPLLGSRFDRTEVDMRLGDLLVEAKLTESDFQRAHKEVLGAYRDFHDAFDAEQLPQTASHFLSYQLLRNVLAAHASGCSFCVLLDARRPDLTAAWYAVMRCVKPVALRTRLQVLTWQELATSLPAPLQAFLKVKYGISS